jgi:hypothetical protein
MAAAGDDGLVRAILIAGGEDDTATQPGDTGPAASVVAEACARAGQPPARVRYLPRVSAVVIEARPSYLRAALEDRRVIVASATTIDIFPWE